MQKLHCSSGEYPYAPAIGEVGDSAVGATPFAARREKRHCPVCGAGKTCANRSQRIAVAHGRQDSTQVSVKNLCRDLSGTAW